MSGLMTTFVVITITTIIIVETILIIRRFGKGDNRLRLILIVELLILITVILGLQNRKDVKWDNLLKISKEIENKEIANVEMGVSDLGIIESVTYIDDDGDKAKIDCSDLDLPNAHVKESDDSKYHITIIEDEDFTVYIPVSKEYTSK